MGEGSCYAVIDFDLPLLLVSMIMLVKIEKQPIIDNKDTGSFKKINPHNTLVIGSRVDAIAPVKLLVFFVPIANKYLPTTMYKSAQNSMLSHDENGILNTN